MIAIGLAYFVIACLLWVIIVPVAMYAIMIGSLIVIVKLEDANR